MIDAIETISAKYGKTPEQLIEFVHTNCFHESSKPIATKENAKELIYFSEKYGLDLLCRMVSGSVQNGVLFPVVNFDGWVHLVNSNEMFDGVSFKYSDAKTMLPGLEKPSYEWIETVIHRKDRQHPIEAREFLEDVFKDQPYWKSHTKRVHRHKSFVQCARIAFGLSGILDEDEIQGFKVASSQSTNGAGIKTAVSKTFQITPTPLRIVDSTVPVGKTETIVQEVQPVLPPVSEETIIEPVIQEIIASDVISFDAKTAIAEFTRKIATVAVQRKVIATAKDNLSTRYSGIELAYAIECFDEAVKSSEQTQSTVQSA